MRFVAQIYNMILNWFTVIPKTLLYIISVAIDYAYVRIWIECEMLKSTSQQVDSVAVRRWKSVFRITLKGDGWFSQYMLYIVQPSHFFATLQQVIDNIQQFILLLQLPVYSLIKSKQNIGHNANETFVQLIGKTPDSPLKFYTTINARVVQVWKTFRETWGLHFQIIVLGIKALM